MGLLLSVFSRAFCDKNTNSSLASIYIIGERYDLAGRGLHVFVGVNAQVRLEALFFNSIVLQAINYNKINQK